MPRYFFQRTTLLGIAVISGALIGTYFNFLDEGTAICLITFSAGGLIPENCPMAHKLLEIIAPLLVREIKKKALESDKTPFEKAPSKGALSLLKPVLAGLLNRKPENSLTLLRKIPMNLVDTTQAPTPSVSDIEKQIVQIIGNAGGKNLSPKTKARLENAGSILAIIIDSVLPLAGDQTLIETMLTNLSSFNEALLQEEAAIENILNALQARKKAV